MKPVSELLKKREATLWHVAPDDTVFDALNTAGGFREFANRKDVLIIRGPKRLRWTGPPSRPPMR